MDQRWRKSSSKKREMQSSTQEKKIIKLEMHNMM